MSLQVHFLNNANNQQEKNRPLLKRENLVGSMLPLLSSTNDEIACLSLDIIYINTIADGLIYYYYYY